MSPAAGIVLVAAGSLAELQDDVGLLFAANDCLGNGPGEGSGMLVQSQVALHGLAFSGNAAASSFMEIGLDGVTRKGITAV